MNTANPTGLSFLFLLLAFYGAAGAASLLLIRGRWRIAALAGALTATLLSIWVWSLNFSLPLWVLPAGLTVDMEAPLALFGYTFQLKATNAPILAIYLLIAALALFISGLHGNDRNFPALVWLILGGYTLLTLFTGAPTPPIVIAPVLLILLTALSVYAIQGENTASVAGSLWTLLPPVLAAPLFLVGGWWLDQVILNPQDLTVAQTAGSLIGVGLLLLLTPFPLHGLWSASSESSPPAATLLVSLFYQLAVLHIAAQTLSAFPFVSRQTDWALWMSALGLITAVWGGIAAAGAIHVGRLWGYAAIHDWGLIVIALAAPGLRSWTLVLFLFALRAISMFTTAVGASALQRQTGTLDMDRLRGIGIRMPWNSAAILLGGLGLVGFPLTAGFAGHWAALQALAVSDWRPAMAIVVASAGAILAFVRLARLMFGSQGDPLIAHEHGWTMWLAVSALVVTIVIATTPQLLNDLITRALAAFG